MTVPSSQWFGSGFGHSGSTSKRGAITAPDASPVSPEGPSVGAEQVASRSAAAMTTAGRRNSDFMEESPFLTRNIILA